MMKHVILLCAFISAVLSKPNGVYHEEFQYKSSQQSYKNNELQEKNDDESFYSKDGDLEGRQRPKVQSHEQHSQYVNPKLQNGYNQGSASIYDNNYGGSSLSSIYDRPTHGIGTGHYSNGQYGSSSNSQYGMSANSHYGSSSQYSTASLSQLTQQLQQDLSRQLEDAVRQQYNRYGDYSMGSTHIQSDTRSLEAELRRNLTEQLENALRTQYGSQATQDGYTYSISGGRISPTANYNTVQLEQMKRQLEDDLVRQLNNQMRNVYTTSSHSSSSSYSTTGGEVSYPNQPRPVSVITHYPSTNYPTYSNYPTYPSGGSSSSISSGHTSHSSYRQYTPIPNPDTITVIATRVQNDLDNYINQVLDDSRTRYLTDRDRYMTVSDLDNYIQNVKYDLQRNITSFFDTELRRNYGTQTNANSYSYSVASDGDVSPTSNYKLSDLENLKRQIEQHLVSKIDRDFQTIKQRFVQMQSSSSSSSSSHLAYRPVQIPYGSTTNGHLVTNNIYGSSGSSGSQMSSYELNNLQRQLQEDLSRQVQEALRQHQYEQSAAYTSSTFNPNQNYQLTLQQLTDELQRNLTQRLQEKLHDSRVSGSSSSSYSYGVAGGSYSPSSGQLTDLQSQLQNDLMRQLQQGLQQSYSKYSSFSARSSYGYGGGQVSGGQVLSDDPYEDCTYSDQPHSDHRHRRSIDEPNGITRTYKYSSHSLGPIHTSHSSSNFHGTTNQRVTAGGDSNFKLGDIFDDDDLDALHKHVRTFSTSHHGSFGGRHHHGLSDSGSGELGSSYHTTITRYPVVSSNSDLENENYNSAGLGSHSYSTYSTSTGQSSFGRGHTRKPFGSHAVELAHGLEDDLKQLTEGIGFGSSSTRGHTGHVSGSVTTYSTGTPQYQKPFNSETEIELGQELDNSEDDLQQQSENFGFGKPGKSMGSHSSQTSGSITRHSYQTSTTRHQKPLSSQSEIEVGQEIDDNDDLQQSEDFGLGKLSTGHSNSGSISTHSLTTSNSRHYKPLTSQTEIELSQEVDNNDDLQQSEDFGFGKLTTGSMSGHSSRPSGSITRHSVTTTNTYQHKPFTGQAEIEVGQEIDDDDLQQSEDFGFGKLTSGSISAQTSGSTRHSITSNTLQHKPFTSQVQTEVDQQLNNINDDLQQQTEDIGFGKVTSGGGRPNHLSDTSEIVRTYSHSTTGRGQHRKPATQINIGLGHEMDDSDGVLQQTEDFGFGKSTSGELTGSHSSQSTTRYSHLTTGSRQHHRLSSGQTENQFATQTGDNDDLKQQSEEFGFGKVNVDNPTHRQPSRNTISVTRYTETQTIQGNKLNHGQSGLGTVTSGSTEVIHQLEDNGFGKLGTLKPTSQHRTITDSSSGKPANAYNVFNTQQHTEYTQGGGNIQHTVQPLNNIYDVSEIEDDKLTQQTVSLNHQSDSIHKVTDGGQQEIEDDFPSQTGETQQIEETGFEKIDKSKLQFGGQQEIEDGFSSQSSITQEIEDSGFGKINNDKLQFGGQEEEKDEFASQNSITQQTEDNSFEKIEKDEITHALGTQHGKSDIVINQAKIDGSLITQGITKDITNFINGEIEDTRKIQETNNQPTQTQGTISTSITHHSTNNIRPANNQFARTSGETTLVTNQEGIDSKELTFGQKLAEEDYLRRLQGGGSITNFGGSGGTRTVEQTSTTFGSSSHPGNAQGSRYIPGTFGSTISGTGSHGYQTSHSSGSYGGSTSSLSTGIDHTGGGGFSYYPSGSTHRTSNLGFNQHVGSSNIGFQSGGSEHRSLFGGNMESDQHPGGSYVLDYSYRRMGVPTVTSGDLVTSTGGESGFSTSGSSRSFSGSLGGASLSGSLGSSDGQFGGTVGGSLTGTSSYPHGGYGYHSTRSSSSSHSSSGGGRIGIKGI